MSSPATASSTTGPAGYEVGHAAGKCAACARAIEPGEKFMAALRPTPTGLERVDVGPECWDAFDKSGLLGFWQSTLRPPQAKPKVFVDDALLCDLFERLEGANEPVKVSFRFVLGLILMRKRLLTYESSRHEPDRDVWTVRLKGRDQLIDLLDPKLDEKQVLEVSTQLGAILNEQL
jgi:hypothetical protein